MANDLLKRLKGNIVSRFSFVRYLSLGIERVLIHLDAEGGIELHTREVNLGKDEAYTLQAEEIWDKEGMEWIDAGWRIGNVRVIRRQDWLESSSNKVSLIGKNPRIHTWGAVGTAPDTAKYRRIVDFGVVLDSESLDHQAMVYLADYPGLVCFITDALEIRSLCDAYQRV